jgi:hypothetical protein
MHPKIKDEVVHFLKELLHPEGFGWSVTHEVRREAYQLLIMIESDSNEQDSTIRQTT